MVYHIYCNAEYGIPEREIRNLGIFSYDEYASNDLLTATYKGGNNNRDAFEPRLFGKIDFERDRESVFNDIKLITDFVDELSLERNIFKN